jgi:putative oxidoreductase
MNNSTQNTVAVVGRILIALIFVLSGFSKIGGFDGTVGYIASKGLPLPALGAVIAIVVELFGGIALILGLYTRWVALAMALFTLAAAVFFHNFWGVPAEQMMNQNIHFMKNISMIGGLLTVFAFGAGAFSLDARRGKQ